MLGLTPKQLRVLNFVKSFIDANGFSPSYVEIGIGLTISSLATVARHISNLEKRGYIVKSKGRARSMVIVK